MSSTERFFALARPPATRHAKRVSERLPEHESGLRRLIADASADAYIAFKSLAEAQAHPDGVVVLEGDDGGQIFAVFPAAQVRCSIAVLEQLLRDLDDIAWPGNDTDASRVVYECRRLGAAVAGRNGRWHSHARGLDPQGVSRPGAGEQHPSSDPGRVCTDPHAQRLSADREADGGRRSRDGLPSAISK